LDYNCGKGKHRFSETGYCDLFGKHGSFKENEQMSKLSCYGLSADAIADVLLKDTWTVGANSCYLHFLTCHDSKKNGRIGHLPWQWD
jgi:hypothetical protein